MNPYTPFDLQWILAHPANIVCQLVVQVVLLIFVVAFYVFYSRIHVRKLVVKSSVVPQRPSRLRV